MFHLNTKQISHRLSVAETALLKPWFSSELLEKGLNVLKEGGLTNFFCFRNGAAALIEENLPVTLLFEKNSQLRQGFTIKHDQCGKCRTTYTKKRCPHLAALAIQSLGQSAKTEKLFPLPLLFQQSCWNKIGDFLYNRAPFTAVNSQMHFSDSCLNLTRISDKQSCKIILPKSCQRLVENLLFSNPKEMHLIDDAMENVRSTLSSFTMTATEMNLEQMGTTSKGWQRDHSFEMWFTAHFHMIYGDQLPELVHDPGSGCFQLVLSHQSQSLFSALTITLPQKNTWEFVQKMNDTPMNIPILSQATECFRVSLNEQNDIVVTPSLRLDNKRIIARSTLQNDRFGAAYHIDSEGFLPVKSGARQGKIKKQSAANDRNPLFSFPKREHEKDLPFTIHNNEIENFLTLNHEALRHVDNIVDPALLQITIRDLPDQLIIHSFEENEDWCSISCSYGLGNTNIRLEDIIKTREKRSNCIPGHFWLKLDNTPLSWLHDQIENRLTTDEHGNPLLRLKHSELLALAAVIPDTCIEIEEHKFKERLSTILNVETWCDSQSLSSFPSHLRPYQRNGLAWLNQLYMLGLGGLLADDMGLGKTHQGLALLQLARTNKTKPLLLVICPASVILHWSSKIDSFYEELDYSIYYGANRNLAACLHSGLIITTYGIVRQDVETLSQLEFDITLFDEIQNIKNKKTAAHQAAAAIKSRVKIGLTGTPIENELTDLYSLFDICMPGFFSSPTSFNRQYVQPIVERKNKEVRKRLSRLIQPFILRRNRKQVLTELPDLIEDNRICRLCDDQIALYRQIIDAHQESLNDLNPSSSKEYMHILATITKLKQVCNHPCLLEDCDDPDRFKSGKWDLFTELLSECMDSGMKVVVFSQYVKMLDIIEKYLKERGIGFATLRGNIAATRRQTIIDRFNNESECLVFSASLLAGGVGIDLTGAQAVIHYDRWWNPAKEEQATARVHRMGQKNVVQLFRLITLGTLEEKIHNLICRKRELASSIIQEDEASIIKQMDKHQLQELFRFSPGG